MEGGDAVPGDSTHTPPRCFSICKCEITADFQGDLGIISSFVYGNNNNKMFFYENVGTFSRCDDQSGCLRQKHLFFSNPNQVCFAPKQTQTSLKLQQKEMWFAELVLLTLTPVIDFAFMVQCHHSYCCNIFCCLKQIKYKNSSDILWISKFVDEVVETKNRAKRDCLLDLHL